MSSYRSSAKPAAQKPSGRHCFPPPPQPSSPHQSVCHKVTSTHSCCWPRIGPELAVTRRNHFHFQSQSFLLSQIQPWKTFHSVGRLRVQFQSNQDSRTSLFPQPLLLLLSCKCTFFSPPCSHWCSFSLYLSSLSPTFIPPTPFLLSLGSILCQLQSGRQPLHIQIVCVRFCVWQQSRLPLFPSLFFTSNSSSSPLPHIKGCFSSLMISLQRCDQCVFS